MRGIVISPVEITGKNSMSVNGGINPVKLRQYLLYWDKIDFPQSNIIGFGDTHEIQFLKSAGSLKQTQVQINLSGELTELYLQGQLKALKMNNEIDRGCWSLAQSNADLLLPKDESILTRNLELELIESLPTPSSDVPLEEILEFKEYRKDELLEFRSLFDNFYLEVTKSSDSERAIRIYVDRIQRKIIEVDKVLNESKISRFRSNVKIRFDLTEAVKNTFLGVGSGTILHFPALGAALGFATSFIKINSEISLKPKGLPEDLKGYAYLYYTEKGLI